MKLSKLLLQFSTKESRLKEIGTAEWNKENRVRVIIGAIIGVLISYHFLGGMGLSLIAFFIMFGHTKIGTILGLYWYIPILFWQLRNDHI